MRLARVLVFVVVGCPLFACAERDTTSFDLDPPRLVTAQRRACRLGITDSIQLRFSEAVAPEGLSDLLAVVPAEVGADCQVDLQCEGGICHAGRCQIARVDAAFIRDAQSPPLATSRQHLVVPLQGALSADGLQAIFQPQRPFAAHRLHQALISPTVRDLAGNPLQLAEGEQLWDCFTDGPDSGRPVARLLRPKDGSANNPRNLRRVVVRFSAPLKVAGSRWLSLRSEHGEQIYGTIDAADEYCPGTDVGSCYGLAIAAPLAAQTTYAVDVDPSVQDIYGRAVLIAAEQAGRFAVGAELDRAAPSGQVSFASSDGCLVIEVNASEVCDARFSIGEREAFSADQRMHRFTLPDWGSPSNHGQLSLSDAAGNVTPYVLALPLMGPAVSLMISEVLANPIGAESRREWIELTNFGRTSIDLAGFLIDDNDDGVGVITLPGHVLAPAATVLVVGPSFDRTTVPAGVALLPVRRSLALANRGEALILRDPLGRRISSFLGLSSQTEGNSLQRSSAQRCDIAENWIEGPPTPGVAP
ncbi:MAG: lamin tail domain-containing protein [Deltaproteobacteria bacterium]|nr:lamin tail domain-containing protein [Deltaproteobacteria bacterium]